MKKIILSLILIFSSICVLAEDNFTFTPVTIVPGEDGGYIEFTINKSSYNENTTGIEFDLEYPAGWTVNKLSFRKAGSVIPSEYDDDLETYVSSFTYSTTNASEPNTKHVMIYDGQALGISFKSGTGSIGRMKVIVPEGTEPGIYPFIIKNCNLADDLANNIDLANTVSYVKVGSPSGASLTLEGEIPSIVNTALASETAITSLDLSAVTASNGTFTYVAGRNVTKPTADVTANVAVVAPAPSKKYASLCLPYAATLNCLTTNSTAVGVDSKVTFKSATSVDAGQSALIKEAVNLDLGEQILKGVAKEAKTSGYYLKNDQFCIVNGTANIPALRGWWDLPAGSKFFIEDEATGIQEIGADEIDGNVYNVAGQRLSKTQRGINIVNGKKILVK